MELNRRIATGAIGAGAFIFASTPNTISANTSTNLRLNQTLSGNLKPVHDPCLIEYEGVFHLFSTSQLGEAPGLIHWRTSKDLREWTLKGAVFQKFPDWVSSALPQTKGAWAPEIVYTNGMFRLYYSLSIFGQNTSIIALATTPTLDTNAPNFGWKDEGIVFRTSQHDDFNAIDPNVFIDSDNRQYLTFGSFWTGIKQIELDPLNGKPKDKKPRLNAIARRRFPGAIEAPTILKRGNYYYLFASFDTCCRGAESTYFMAVGRSRNINGPYIDKSGIRMSNDGGTIILHASQDSTRRFKGPGGGSIFQINGKEIIVYHAYDANDKGAPTLRLSLIYWSDDGWPSATL